MLQSLEKLAVLFLVFSIPFQKRTFLFGPEEFLEWNSAFFYFTDALVLALFAFWVFGRKRFEARHVVILLVFVLFAFVSLSQAELVNVGAYRFLKLVEFIFLFFYIVARARYVGVGKIMAAFIISGVFQSALAILQFAKQSSLGLQVFHESTLEIGMRGVAEITTQGIEMIRAYGTFTNPNVLAGFLGISLFFAFYLFLKTKAGTVPAFAAIFILSFGLLLTFSRGVIIFFIFTSILFFAGIFLFKRFNEYKKAAIYLLVLVVVSWSLIIFSMWPEVSSRFLESSISEPAISERLFFNKVGVDISTQNYSQLFFGVGIGNFVDYYMGSIPDLARHLYQPVHNIFILIASEIGILGLGTFILFLASLIGGGIKDFFTENSLLTYSLLLITFYILLISMYDHYFWTLQQGSLMFWIVLGLLASAVSRRL